ncbi:MAG: phytoene desaturase [Sphingobacteriia bacterium]|nr:phytoene desaturase [Sphingobacteriia bacterium]
MTLKSNSVIIIGSGLGGLASAITLASQGYSVRILEKNKQAGGKANEIVSDGFRFDTGPSLLTMDFVFRDIFSEAHKNIENYLSFIPIDPICKYFYPDHTIVNAWRNPEQFSQNLPENLKSEEINFKKYINYCAKIYNLTADLFLLSPLWDYRHLFKIKTWNTLINLRAIDPFRSVHQANKSFFNSTHLIQLFDRYATYNGSNPYQAPATLNIIPHVEMTLGSWYVKGGIYRLIEAFVKLATELGVIISYETEVSEIQHKNKSITGIKLSSGEYIPTNKIICNADVVFTHSHLIQPKILKAEKLAKVEPSSSGLVFLWGINKKHPELSHHNIFFSEDYKAEFDDIFIQKINPTDPTVYVSITSKSDRSHAPENGENWFVLINMPYLQKNSPDRESTIILMKQRILSKLKKQGVEILPENIITEHIISPEDLRNNTHSNAGSIYGISSNSQSAAFLRQPNRCKELRGLYFSGGSAHPGGGMPLVVLSGKHAAHLLMKDFPL